MAAAHGCSLAGLQALHAAGLQHEPQLPRRLLNSWEQAINVAAAVGSPTTCWREKAEWLEAQGLGRLGPDAYAASVAAPDAAARLRWLHARGCPLPPGKE